MTTEQILRDQLDRATEHVPGGPDLERAVRTGRRRRGLRRGGLAVAAVAVLGVGAAGMHTMTAGDGTTVVHEHKQGVPVAAAPAGPTDYVPGTDVDAKLAAVVAAHLPSLPAADDVYPSDSHTAGPMPDADFASAEDWQAAYTLPDGHEFLLMTALASEGHFSCQRCEHHAAPGGDIYRQPSQSLEDGRWQYATWYVRDDGSTVGAFEYVPGQVDAPPEGGPVLADSDLDSLVQDPGLTFAALGATTP